MFLEYLLHGRQCFIFYMCYHMFLTSPIKCHHLHFTEKEIKAQRAELTCPKLHS